MCIIHIFKFILILQHENYINPIYNILRPISANIMQVITFSARLNKYPGFCTRQLQIYVRRRTEGRRAVPVA